MIVDLLGFLASVPDAAQPFLPPWLAAAMAAANGEELTEDDAMDVLFDMGDHPMPGWGKAAKQTYERGKANTEDYVERRTKAADRAYGQKNPPTRQPDGSYRFADGTEAEQDSDGYWVPKK